MFLLKSGSFTKILGSTGSVIAALLFESKYFYNWVGIKVLVSLNHWSYNAYLKKITLSVLISPIAFNIILANLEAVKKKTISLI